MQRLAFCALLCIVLFAGAFGAAHLLQGSIPGLAESEQGVSAESPLGLSGLPPARLQDNALNGPEGELAIPLRPRPISTEEAVRLGASIRDREQSLKMQKEALEKERLQLRLIAEDISAERREVEALQLVVQERVASAETLLATIEEQRQSVLQERKRAQQEVDGIKAAQTVYKESEMNNLKRMSAWFQNLEPDTAADYLKQLSNDGKLDLVVQLLGEFEERDAAEILEAVNDPQLVVEVMEKFKGLQPPKTVESKR